MPSMIAVAMGCSPGLHAGELKTEGCNRLGLLPLPAGERGGVRGFGSIDEPVTPSPPPSPQMGRGSRRVCGAVVHHSHRTARRHPARGQPLIWRPARASAIRAVKASKLALATLA